MRETASTEMRAAAAAMRENSGLVSALGADGVDVAAMRGMMAMTAAALPDGAVRQDFDQAGLALTRITGPVVRPAQHVIYLHGGGYVLGSLDTHAELMGRLAIATEATVLGVDYRLAPEHPYPAAVDDAVAAYEWLLGEGVSPGAIVFAGDSAGGGLALACLLRLKDAGVAMPAGAVLFSPWTDLTASGESIQSRAELDPVVGSTLLDPMAALYAGAEATGHPLISPLFGALRGLPPLLVQVGDHEILLDDSQRLVTAAREVGVEVEFELYPEGFHVFQIAAQLPESAEAMDSAGRFCARLWRMPG